MIEVHKAERCPYTELELDAKWDAVEAKIGPPIRLGDRDRYLMRAVQFGVISKEEAHWMYLVALGFAVNSNVFDAIHG